MMVPALPRPHLAVRQPRLPFDTPQTLLDPVLRLERAGELGHGKGQLYEKEEE